MIIVTSLSPGHANVDNQATAIESWQQFGKCYSLNNPMEVNKLKDLYRGIEFVETHKTVQVLIKKPMVCINAMIDFAIAKDEDLLLTNSDIIITKLPELKQDGITMISRYDYMESFEDAKIFSAGFDVFFIPKKFLKVFPTSIYAMGVSWWDYFIPFRAMEAKVPVYWPQGKYALHKWHETQYDYKEWCYIGDYFKLEFNWDKQMDNPKIATAALLKIQTQSIKSDMLKPTDKTKNLDIFYKSWHKDFWLLYLSLQSLAKNVTGYNNIVILIPEDEKELFDTRKLPETILGRIFIHYVKEEGHGYLFQQWCKVSAYNYTHAEFILFADSDCIWDHKIDLAKYVDNGKPEILFTDYEQIPDAKIWIEPTSNFIKETVKFEFMRRNCLIYHRDTLVAISAYAPDLKKTILNAEKFSEFNAIGAYAFKFERDKYSFINTDDWQYVPPKSEQVWSHANKIPGQSETHHLEYIRTLETIMRAFDVPIPE